MKVHCTERVIVPDGESPVFGRGRIIVRIEDEAAGPFISAIGTDHEAPDGIDQKSICFESEADIDLFAEVCKQMLREHKQE